MSTEKKLSGSIALTKMLHVMMDKKGSNGNLVRGIFIPLEANMLTEKDKAVYVGLNVVIRDEQDQYGQNGFIAKTTDSKIWKTLDDAGKETAKKLSPILGNLKDFTGGGNDASGAASATVVSDEDDLPFN
ncbi:hypothetical protein A0256_23385 [Mucilaginibacter sp. PAMC 26640]|nr:hypothetical protein A0256_23385 [Mucilaginibacter sp. PAMC 26640]